MFISQLISFKLLLSIVSKYTYNSHVIACRHFETTSNALACFDFREPFCMVKIIEKNRIFVGLKPSKKRGFVG